MSDAVPHESSPRPTRLFQNGNSQAVRIPKELAYQGTDVAVEIRRSGEELIVSPVKRKVSGLGPAFRQLGPFFRDFRRDQPVQDRDWDRDSVHGEDDV